MDDLVDVAAGGCHEEEVVAVEPEATKLAASPSPPEHSPSPVSSVAHHRQPRAGSSHPPAESHSVLAGASALTHDQAAGGGSATPTSDATAELQGALRAAANAAGRVAEEQLRMLPGRLDAAKRAAAAISAPHIDAAKRAAAPAWETTKLAAARQLQALPGRLDALQRWAMHAWAAVPRSRTEFDATAAAATAAATACVADTPRLARSLHPRQWAAGLATLIALLLLLRFLWGLSSGGGGGRRASLLPPLAQPLDDPQRMRGGSLLPASLSADPSTEQIAVDLAPWDSGGGGDDAGGVQWPGIAALLGYDAAQPAEQRRLVLVTVLGGAVVIDGAAWAALPRWRVKLRSFGLQLQAVLDGLPLGEADRLPPVAFLLQVGSSPFLTPARLADIGGRTVPPLTLPHRGRGRGGSSSGSSSREGGRGSAQGGGSTDEGGGDEEGEGEEADEEDEEAGGGLSRGGGRASSSSSLPPVFSMARSDADADVLYPNPYFGTPAEWHAQAAALIESAEAHPWGGRRRKAFWRGSCVGYPGSLPRVQLVALHKEPLLDVAFTRKCPVRDWKAPLFRSAAEHERVTGLAARLPKGARVDALSFASFRMLAHLPGSTEGSYSRNLQVALGTGAAVLVWDSPFFEFYYRQLQAGTHYVAVNASSVLARVQWLARHDADAQAVGAAALAWFRSHLRGADIQAYWLALLRAYAALQRFQPQLPPNACTCAARRRLPVPGRAHPVNVARCSPTLCPGGGGGEDGADV